MKTLKSIIAFLVVMTSAGMAANSFGLDPRVTVLAAIFVTAYLWRLIWKVQP